MSRRRVLVAAGLAGRYRTIKTTWAAPRSAQPGQALPHADAELRSVVLEAVWFVEGIAADAAGGAAAQVRAAAGRQRPAGGSAGCGLLVLR